MDVDPVSGPPAGGGSYDITTDAGGLARSRGSTLRSPGRDFVLLGLGLAMAGTAHLARGGESSENEASGMPVDADPWLPAVVSATAGRWDPSQAIVLPVAETAPDGTPILAGQALDRLQHETEWSFPVHRAGSTGFQPARGRSPRMDASRLVGGLHPPGRLEAGAPSTIEVVPIRRNRAQRRRYFVVTAIVPAYPCAGDRLRP
ncbi:MAG: hypothetical protein GY856_25210 [bacterium]|nr:hypothetical protein [bacterium]